MTMNTDCIYDPSP